MLDLRIHWFHRCSALAREIEEKGGRAEEMFRTLLGYAKEVKNLLNRAEEEETFGFPGKGTFLRG